VTLRPSALIADLIRVSQELLLEEKWLLAPTLRAGAQWLDQVALSGQPAVNFRVKTLKSLALELAAPELAAAKLTPLNERGAALLVLRILEELRPELGYLAGVEPSLRTARTVLRSIQGLRLAGLAPADLAAASFEAASKGEDVRRILEAYGRETRRLRLADASTILDLAAKRLGREPGALPAGARVLLPPRFMARGLEKNLVEAIPASRRIQLAGDEPAGPPGGLEGRVDIFHAVGEVNEVREALRRIHERGLPFDQVEILHTDAATYVPLLYEVTLGIAAGAGLGAPEEEITEGRAAKSTSLPPVEAPITIAEGLPCRYFRPGRALAAWVAWIRGGFPQSTLVPAIREGLFEGDVPEQRLASALRSVAIGSGRSRYLENIDKRIRSLERIARGEGGEALRDAWDEVDVSGAVDDRDALPDVKGDASKSLAELRAMRETVADLIASAPRDGAEAGEVLCAAGKLVATKARVASEADGYARKKLVEEIEDMARWIETAGAGVAGAARLDVWDWLAKLPAEASVLGSGPRPGRLHAAHWRSGGHSGRPLTFLIGLDDTRFPASGGQDPLLLDAERNKISAELPTAASRSDRESLELASVLAGLRGEVVLGFSSRSLADNAETFPSPFVLASHRARSGRSGDDLSDLLRALGPPASFAPASAAAALDETEWWLWRFCGPDVIENAEELVALRFPHLARGRRAGLERASEVFTEFDGRVPAAGKALDPTSREARALSASQLETAGECCRKYFFKYALGLEKPADLAPDPDVWLDPLQRGKLLHVVFEEFVAGLVRSGEPPRRDAHAERLQKILDRRVEAWREILPPPNEISFRREVRELKQIVSIFLTEEEAYARDVNAAPVYLEASLGLPSRRPGTDIDTPEPLTFMTPEGEIRVRGRVDRIDRLGPAGKDAAGAPPTFAIWDYKTGSQRKYASAGVLGSGLVLQPALYAAIVQKRLRNVVSPAARVASFGFFFTSARELGVRRSWTAEELEKSRAAVGRLCGLIRSGAFLATTQTEERCRFCDYKKVCGDVSEAGKQSGRKIANDAEPLLAPMRKQSPETGRSSAAEDDG